MGRLENGIWVDWIEKVKVLQKAVVVNPDGNFLALKRCISKHDGRSGCWDLCGGSVDIEDVQAWKSNSGGGDKDDILVKAIAREVAEETGLSVLDSKTIHSASGFNDKKGVFTVAIGFRCTVAGDQNVKLSPEHTEYKWVTKDEFLTLDLGDDNGLIKSILAAIEV